jgi:hypothetical protein
MPMPRRGAVWIVLIAGAAAFGMSPSTFAADRFFLYNLTTVTTFTGVYLAPAGSDHWGHNQALNDKDKAIDPSERLPIKDIEHGRFDVKLVDRKGRTCVRHGIDLSKDTTFDIRDTDLTDCH